MRALFLADWVEVVFMHFRVAPRHVQPIVPMPLDLFDGDAYVSLVAFTQRRLRPSAGGRLARLLATPLAEHEFFNVRTYVRGGDSSPGILFLAEWIPNRLAALIGPRMYGLPYRVGRLRYHNEARRNEMRGEIASAGRRVNYRASPQSGDPHRAKVGTLDHFLLELYVAFTHRADVTRRFDVAHDPWPQVKADVELRDTSLLRLTGRWCDHAELIGGNYSAGVSDVAISAPAVVAAPRQQSTNRPPTASPFRSAGPACRSR